MPYLPDTILTDPAIWDEFDLAAIGCAPGDIVTIQNKGCKLLRIWYGPAAPTDDEDGLRVPLNNWPEHDYLLETGDRLFLRGEGRVHVSKGS